MVDFDSLYVLLCIEENAENMENSEKDTLRYHPETPIKIIGSETELRRFFDEVVPPLKKSELFFASLSARDKYLTDEEREFYKLGRTEMFERRLILERDWRLFSTTIKKYECVEGAYTCDNGAIIPSKCVMVYWNINPSNAVDAYFEFNENMAKSMRAYIKSSKADTLPFTNSNRLLMNQMQKNRGTKHHIDIDVDFVSRKVKNSEVGQQVLNRMTAEFKSHGVKFFVVDTHGGYHFLLKKETIKYDYTKFVEALHETKSEGVIKECKVNENEMVCLPGTFQGDHLVHIMYEISNL